MSTSTWRQILVAVVALSIVLPGWAQKRPNDSTAGRGAPVAEAPDKNDAEQDNATDRLVALRQAWGTVTPAFRNLALKEGKTHSAGKYSTPGQVWVNIGPTGSDYEQNGSFTGHVRDSGRARTILPHPTKPNIVYFLTSGGGLWVTYNWQSATTNWIPLTDDLPTTGGGSVAFGKNPSHLYLGLGDPYDQILVGGSMVKSTNGGSAWSPLINLGSTVSVRDVKVDTSTASDIVMVATNDGLYRSTNSGTSYSAIATFAGLSVWSIQRTSAGWLASAQPCAAANVGLQCASATTLYISVDLGATWNPITNAGGIFSANGRTTLAAGLPGDSVVYAYSSVVGDAQMRDVYRSSDGGQTWVANGVNSTKVPLNPVTGMTNMNICHGQCWYNQMILVDPTDVTRNTVWIGGDLATARTTNGGTSWSVMTWWLYSQFPVLPYAHADHHAAAFKTTGTPTLILGNDGGLNISTDNGVSFSSDKNNSLTTHLFYTVAGHAEDPDVVIGGLQDNGTRLRTDTGTIYNQVIGGDGVGAAFSQANTNTSMGSSQSSGIRMNFHNNPPDTFQNWVGRGTLTDSAGTPFLTCIVPAPASLDPTGRVFFHFTNSRVWRTNDGGLTFINIGSATAPTSPGIPAARRFRSSPYNLGVSPTDLNRIAVGAGGGFLDITTDGGATWTDVDMITLVPGYAGFVTNVTWQDNQTIWVTAVAQAVGAVRVIKGTIATPASPWSTATWTPMQTGLPDLPVSRVYLDPRDVTKQTLYAATHVGIYITTNGGATWSTYSNGLPTVRVNDIYMPPDGSFMRIATYGRGIWELAHLDLVSAVLDDDITSCDADDVLDNGETGELTVTLLNRGPVAVGDASVKVTSTNPNVSFPLGNEITMPPLPPGATGFGVLRVALNGASGLEVANLKLSITATEHGNIEFNTYAIHRVNYDEQLAASATETFEGAATGWTVSGDPVASPNVDAWQRRVLSPTQHVWWGPDNNGQTDGVKADLPDEQILTSPSMAVGASPLTITLVHRFAFEAGNWDAGVIEISNNGGASWTDIGTSAYNGSTNVSTSAPIGANRPAFVVRNTGWPAFSTSILNLGTTYMGQNVIIRLHVGSDESTGAPGWEVDSIAVAGLTNTPFTTLVGEPSSCP